MDGIAQDPVATSAVPELLMPRLPRPSLLSIRCRHLAAALGVTISAAIVTSPAAAQETGSVVTGEVLDVTGDPVPAVDVLRAEGERLGQTDSVGRFRLTGLRPGTIRLTFRRIGFQSATLDAQVPASGERHYRITLRPFVPQLDEVRVSADLAIPSAVYEMQRKWEDKHQVHTLFAEDLARYDPVTVDDLFRRVGEFAFLLGRPNARVCAVVDDRWVPEGQTVGEYVAVEDVAVVQVIRSADLVPAGLLPTPPRAGLSPRMHCRRVILVYTKWFRPRNGAPPT